MTQASTRGATPDFSTPKAMVADNDLALGQIVEALSKSPFWRKMAILVVEDDAQNGVDHVVTDTGAGLHHSANGLGTGLTTLRERLQLIFGDAAHLRLVAGAPRGVVVEVDMPAHT